MKKQSMDINRRYLILDNRTPFAVREAYKAARSNLMFLLSAIEGCKTVSFTSSCAMEGKTTSCLNMAVSFAQAGSRVLLIDADMRKPQLNHILSLPLSPGLSDVLAGRESPRCLYKTSVERLTLLPAGTIPPNPSELLLSKKFEKLLSALSDVFDYIFVDCPPVGVVTDAAVITSMLAGAVVVSRQGVTQKPELSEACRAIEQTGGRVLGHVFNDVNVKKYNYKKGAHYGRNGYGGYYDDSAAVSDGSADSVETSGDSGTDK